MASRRWAIPSSSSPEQHEVGAEGGQGLPLVGPGVEAAGQLHRLLRLPPRLAVAAGEHEGLGHRRHHPGPLRHLSRPRPHQRHRLLVGHQGGLGLARGPQVAAERLLEQAGADRVGRRVDAGEGLAHEDPGPVVVARQVGGLRGPGPQRRPVAADEALGVVGLGSRAGAPARSDAGPRRSRGGPRPPSPPRPGPARPGRPAGRRTSGRPPPPPARWWCRRARGGC